MVLYAYDRAQVSTNQLHPTQALVGLLGNFLTRIVFITPKAANEMPETVTEKNFYNDDGYNNACDDNFGRPATENA